VPEQMDIPEQIVLHRVPTPGQRKNTRGKELQRETAMHWPQAPAPWWQGGRAGREVKPGTAGRKGSVPMLLFFCFSLPKSILIGSKFIFPKPSQLTPSGKRWGIAGTFSSPTSSLTPLSAPARWGVAASEGLGGHLAVSHHHLSVSHCHLPVPLQVRELLTSLLPKLPQARPFIRIPKECARESGDKHKHRWCSCSSKQLPRLLKCKCSPRPVPHWHQNYNSNRKSDFFVCLFGGFFPMARWLESSSIISIRKAEIALFQ